MNNWISNKLSKLNKLRTGRLIRVLLLIIPLIITDVVIIGVIYYSERNAKLHEMENVANGTHYTLYNQADSAAQLAKGIYTSRYVNDFINTEFDSDLDFYSRYHEFFNDTLIDLVDGASSMNYTFYLDNDTIISGSKFQNLAKASDFDWYKTMQEEKKGRGLFFEYDGKERRIYFFQKLNFYDKTSNNILLIEIEYSSTIRTLMNLNYSAKTYIADEDRILLSNSNYSSVGKEFTPVENLTNIGYTTDISLYGQGLTIYVVDDSDKLISSFKGWWILIVLLFFFNILAPLTILNMTTIREQEMMVARKNAELLALHSQINPHFLFNALESIRMHSILKGENETAEMVEKLAKLQRQYTEWQQDFVSVEKEMQFVSVYLDLQKYRFGERLSFELDVDEECQEIQIPKLSIVTFVENACVHGIESKITPGWIFVRVSKADNNLIMEIEDTGNGMSEDEASALLERMQNASLERLKEKGRVGIVNACLRLKMISDNKVDFGLESEEGIGTIVTIKLPIDR